MFSNGKSKESKSNLYDILMDVGSIDICKANFNHIETDIPID